MNKNILAVLSILAVLLIAGCVQQPAQPPVEPAGETSLEPGTYKEPEASVPDTIETKQFQSEDELMEMISGSQSSQYYGLSGMARNFANADMAMEQVAPTAGAEMAKTTSSSSSSGGVEFSGTNNQEENVDEADILKTDGDFIYTISDNVLYIVDALPGEESEVVSTIDFDENMPTGLFIDGDHMAVFGNFYDNDWFQNVDFTPRHGMTFYNIYDVSDRENPKLIKEYKFEGRYYNGRLLDGYSYILVMNQPYNRPTPMPYYWDGTTRHNIEIGDMYYYNVPYNYPQLMTVHAVDLEGAQELSSKAVMVEGSQNMYMSENSIYITYTEWINEYELQTDIMIELLEDQVTESDKELIQKIKETDNEVLSQYEKEQKINNIYLSYLNFMGQEEREELEEEAEELLKKKIEAMEYLEYTVINKIDVDDGDINPVANGKVPGRIINQFSMDEYEDVLRIGTTVSARWSRFGIDRTESENNVYTLDEELDIIGELVGLAEGESIYSTRFIGDRLYMVTFRQIDPFFVIDLSDPENPAELGKLKIPGFSRYLHPYDEDVIIGIGQDASTTGRTKGLKISLFDVSDVEEPEEISKFVTEERYAQSTALYEHKAFLFNKERNLLVIPAYSNSYSWQEEQQEYNGAFVFHIDKQQIKLRGLVDHSMAASSRYGPTVERSLFIEDLLYTKSPKLIRVNALDDLHSVQNVSLTTGPGDIIIY